ncbi:MAG: 2-C-methyl-D-erythritol 4-phosphate cytidylyltransferase [Ruminococcus sp.]|jgi:2-C-methyl-D-erythritol 4-phosphate cytidylyltransferase|nr:2-C-methyl-D-erythritol 4-phosphate cytidylyltransferase [Ruminococcus sp.]
MKINVTVKTPPGRNMSVIIPCGGNSTRMGNVNKMLLRIDGVPIFIKSAQIFSEIENTAEIVFSVKADLIDEFKAILNEFPLGRPMKIVSGGETRQQSVFNAFAVIKKDTRFICIHDGARPFANPETIKRSLKSASIFGASVLGVPVKDTIKVVESGLITDTPDRRKLWAVQTPQIFKREIYIRGMNFAAENNLDFTDDAALAEAVGVKVHITESDYGNFKITTADDCKSLNIK